MEENCEDCMKWEEELYWTHFQTLHFTQLLLPGFHNRLVIPRKFSTHCKRKLPQIVTLKSPSGVTYNVGVEEDDEKTMAFRFGWDKFVKDHSLEENDLLVFKFHGVSEFEVLVFDGQTLCEKPTSYFVRKCGHAEKTKGIIDFNATSSRSPKRHFNPDDVETTPNQQLVISPPVDNELEDLIDIDLDFDIDKILNPLLVASHTGYEQEEHINSDIDTASAQLPVISPTSTVRVSEGKYPLSGFKKMRRELSNDNLDQKADVEMISAGSNKKALSLAKRAISPDGFLVFMKRSHVVSKCFLTIPYKWCVKNMLITRQEVVMQVDQTKWEMKFNIFGARGSGGISTGWKKFVQDNNLREGDVCVFEPANSETKPLHLNVYIFRGEETERTNNVDPVYTISE
ncbi:putative transcription factor B3-Domain family [Arabidopsis thaliana]|uniref:AP2/B3-like transcriptional factor family protein n=1 Tax=Arabidopsis thaliana TaxID=3702 RepID=A0A1P8B393_ARATH|nr:AP2/B3-like transcriptional factor family protein [Arabidopsis thaliana]ANM66063.1 AP2/B3-like transcriptional factor family protein [Arabidopsis thaliana]|eukprot:NP_001327989.1 AP2/B3-like transcriptional factor family protein [Arabidopsis thaliana]